MNRCDDRLRLLLVCSTLNVAGGLERVIVNFANELSLSNFNVILLITDQSRCSFYPINAAIKIINIPLNFGITLSENRVVRKYAFCRHISQFKRIVAKENPHIIINTEYPFTVASILSGLHKQSKVISWEHGDFYSRKSTFWRLLIKWSYRKVHTIVCLNNDEKELYKRYKAQEVVVIPNFLKLDNSLNTSKEKLILTVARLVPAKGLDYLMNVAKSVLNQYSGWKWKVIGSGDMAIQLREFINANNLQNQLLLQPSTSYNINEEYAKASIYVMTSRHERLPMVLLEAMGQGTPCIAFDCDTGPRHIINNGIDGLLVEKGNTKELISSISHLIENDEKRLRMGKAALENVKRFSDHEVIEMWKSLFVRLLS